MLQYNTQLKKLILPEYGRNIQRMVDHCLTLESREERTLAAHSIVKAMASLFPELRTPQHAHKLWDHLAIMSDFKLDIDWPCDVIRQESLSTDPAKVPYTLPTIRYRHYGKCLERLIDVAAAMEPSEEREALVLLIANHMKKDMLAVNRDGAPDQKIFDDLAEMSHGAIRLDSTQVRLHEFKAAPAPAGSKKKKKK